MTNCPTFVRTALLALTLTAAGLAAQPQFEVATVKVSPPPPGDAIVINLGTFKDGRLTFGNASLSDLLKFAYSIVADDQIAGPDWIKSKAVRFDIVAQTSPDTPIAQLRTMLQPLLEERLGVKLHHESRAIPHLVLVVGKNGPRLQPPNPDAKAAPNSVYGGKINGGHISMQGLATLISRFERQTVIDETGLKGEFTVHLEWALTPPAGLTATTDNPSGPSVFTAVQEQLGLKLESRKSPIDVLVIDHAEQVPTSN